MPPKQSGLRVARLHEFSLLKHQGCLMYSLRQFVGSDKSDVVYQCTKSHCQKCLVFCCVRLFVVVYILNNMTLCLGRNHHCHTSGDHIAHSTGSILSVERGE